MKCFCVIFVIYFIVFASGESKVTKDSEVQLHRHEEKIKPLPSIEPLKAPKKPPQEPHAPFKPDDSNLRLSGSPPDLSLSPILLSEPPKTAKIKFTTAPPTKASTTTTESRIKTKPSGQIKAPQTPNLLVPSPNPSLPLLSSAGLPYWETEEPHADVKPDSSMLTLFGLLPDLSPPPAKQSEPPTTVEVRHYGKPEKPQAPAIPDRSMRTLFGSLPDLRPPRAKGKARTTVPPTEASTKTTEPFTTIKPFGLKTKPPSLTNLLVPSHNTTSTTAKPLFTSTDLPYWKPKSPPKNFSSGHQILLPKVTPKRNSSKVSEKPYDPCAPFKKPPVPDFSAPGRRISEIKCYDYIWDLKVRNDEAEQKQECETARMRGGISNYIVGGHYTFTGDYPNMGAIGWKAVIGTWKFMCGCTLISHNFVLTAAHCSSASELDTTIADVIPKIVRLGDKNIQDVKNGTNDDAKIIRIINHPKYKSPKKYFDIALMELDQRLKFSIDIQPACLWTKDTITRYGDEAQVTGWGVVESGSLKTSPELLAATVDIIDFDKCNRLLRMSCNRNWCGLQPDQLCAGKLGGGVDACQGDSGGPLQVKIPLPIGSEGTMHYVLGVTSFGVGCALPGLPGVYTKVASFIDWIEEIVWPSQNGTTPDIKVPDVKRSVRSIPEGPLLGWKSQIKQSNV